MQSGAFASGLGRGRVNLARVSVEQTVERAIAEGGGEHAPQTNDKEDQFDLHGCNEIKHDHGRPEGRANQPLRASDVPH